MPKSKIRKKSNRPATGSIPPVRKMIHLDPLPTDRQPTGEELALSILSEMFVLSVAGTQRYDKVVATNLTNHDSKEARDWLEVACMAISRAYDAVNGDTELSESFARE